MKCIKVLSLPFAFKKLLYNLFKEVLRAFGANAHPTCCVRWLRVCRRPSHIHPAAFEGLLRNNFLLCFPIPHPVGVIQEDYLRELLTTMGDRFTDEEVDELYREAPIDKKGNFNYIEFTRILKHGAKDKDDWANPWYLQITLFSFSSGSACFPLFFLGPFAYILVFQLLPLCTPRLLRHTCTFAVRLEMGREKGKLRVAEA